MIKLLKLSLGEGILLAIIVVIGGFLRLYHLPDTIMFRGDQGRDAIVAKNIVKNGDVALIGPIMSVGNLYLGPFYYYFMAPFLALSYPSPLGPAYGVAVVNIITVGLVYFLARRLFNKPAALAAALLLSVMAVAVQYSRFSWNPNIAPLFTVLVMWSGIAWWKNHKLTAALGMWASAGILIQLHYVSLTAVATIGIFMVLRMLLQKEYKLTLLHLLLGVLVFILLQAPLILFDFRHNHLISQGFVNFFTSPEQHMDFTDKLGRYVSIFPDRISFVFLELMKLPPLKNYAIPATVLLLVGILYCWQQKRVRSNPGILLVFLWLLMTAMGITFYRHSVFVHYLTYSYPVIALFWGFVFGKLWERKLPFKLAGLSGLVLLVYMNAVTLAENSWNGQGLTKVRDTVDLTLPAVTEPYNIVLLSDDRDYKGMNYRYFFETTAKMPKSQYDYGDLKTLVIIDEINVSDPLSVPIYEIQQPDLTTLIDTITVPDGPMVFIYQ